MSPSLLDDESAVLQVQSTPLRRSVSAFASLCREYLLRALLSCVAEVYALTVVGMFTMPASESACATLQRWPVVGGNAVNQHANASQPCKVRRA